MARLRGRPAPLPVPAHHGDPEAVYRTPFYTHLRAVIAWCVGHRYTVIVATLAIFVGRLGAVPVRAAAVLPVVVAGRAAGRPAAAGGQLVRGHRWRRRRSSRPCWTRSRASRASSPTSASAVRASTCRSTSSSQQANFAQFVRHREAASRSASRCATRLLALFDDDFPSLRGRISRLENGPPVGLPGAVPRVRRGRRHRPPHRARGRRRDARGSRDGERAVRLGRAVEGDPRRDRPEQGARARHLVAGPGHVPQQLAVRLLGHLLPRARQAGRGAAARRRRGAREDELPQGPRDPVAQRPRRADHADRRHPLRTRGRHRLAPRPAADDHRARRRRRATRRGPTWRTVSCRSSRRSAWRCRWATGSSRAARSRTRRAASVPSPPARRCCCSPCSRC